MRYISGLASQSTTPGMKHLAQLRYGDVDGRPVACCCTLIAQGVLSILFTAMLLLEWLACCCDSEQRPLSMQVMGTYYVRIGVTFKGRPGNAGGGLGWRVFFVSVIVAMLVLAAAVAHTIGYFEWLSCHASCTKTFGAGPGVCTGLCDVSFKVQMDSFRHKWGI